MRAPKILAVAPAARPRLPYGCTHARLVAARGCTRRRIDLACRAAVQRTPGRRCHGGGMFRRTRRIAKVEPCTAAAARGWTVQGGSLRARRRGCAGGVGARPAHTGDDLAGRDAPLATPPGTARRARATRRRHLLHRACSPTSGDTDELRDRFGIPVVYYDDVADEPAGVRRMDTGFNHHHGGDPSEDDLVLSNSKGRPRAYSSSVRADGGSLRGGGESGVLRSATGCEGDGRLLLRLRRQVPSGVDRRDGR